ncbi:MAG: spore coat associated protein CotJA [Ruminococcaceae bacterium]|nr:spore coat associated protein CotJA [Oscillospiraceae bacterium]
MSPIPYDAVPAMAYVPFQEYGEVYEDLKALECGTLFPVLNKPFLGKRGDNK